MNVPAALAYYRRQEQLDRPALEAYQKLYDAARSALDLGDYLKIISGYRHYTVDAARWRDSLLAVFKMLGCTESTTGCLLVAMRATDEALLNSSAALACNAWEARFRAELKKRSCTVQCMSARVEWLAKKYSMSAADPVAVAIYHKRLSLAPATSSPHGTGRALDLWLGSAASTAPANVKAQRAMPAYRWMACNASRFGFHPYNVEPWHWEYNPAA